MSVEADGVRIDRRLQSLRNRLRAGPSKNFVTRQSGLERFQQRILHAVRRGKAGCQPLRGGGFARLQHIGQMLRIGVQSQIGDAEVGPQQIARLDHRVAAQHPFRALALDADRRVEPGRQAQRSQRIAIPPFDIRRGGRAGGDDFAGKGARDQRMRNADNAGIEFHLFRNAVLEPACRQRFPRHDAVAVGLRQRRTHKPVLAQRHPVAKGAEVGEVDRDLLRVALCHDIRHRLPLVGLRTRLPCRFEQIAEPVSAHGQPLHRLAFARIVKDQDGAAPRTHALPVQHGRDDGLLEIFARHQHPHVDALFAHDLRHHRVEPFGQDAVDNLGTLPHRQQFRHVRSGLFAIAHGDLRRRGVLRMGWRCGKGGAQQGGPDRKTH